MSPIEILQRKLRKAGIKVPVCWNVAVQIQQDIDRDIIADLMAIMEAQSKRFSIR